MSTLSVFGLAPDQQHASDWAHQVADLGVRQECIKILVAGDLMDHRGEEDADHRAGTSATRGVTTGAAVGSVVAGVLGATVIALPPLGALGLAVLGLHLGATLGALTQMGVSEVEATRYEGRLRDGHVLVAVSCQDREGARRIAAFLAQVGAEEVTTSIQQKDEPLDPPRMQQVPV